MKQYKFIISTYPDVISKNVNTLIKKGYLLEDWKLNNNTVVVLLSKENKDE